MQDIYGLIDGFQNNGGNARAAVAISFSRQWILRLLRYSASMGPYSRVVSDRKPHVLARALLTSLVISPRQ